MKNSFLPRAFAAIAATIVTFSLFDQVATMGQYPESTAAASVAQVAVAYEVAVA
jgi:hypothetical protein